MQPEKLKETFCRLCLNAISNTDCQVIEAVRDALEIVLPKLSLEEQDEHFICEECSIKLFAAFNFKATCVNTEDIIFPHINASKVSGVNLTEVYLKEKGNFQLLDISQNLKICRLCFQSLIYGFVALNEVDVDILGTYIPQINFDATLDPVICGPCFDSLRTHGSFLKNCLDAQEKFKSVDKQSYIKTGEMNIKLDDQDVQEIYRNIDGCPDTGSEATEIVSIDEYRNSDSSLYDLFNETAEHKKTLAPEGVIIIEDEDKRNYETEFIEIPRSETAFNETAENKKTLGPEDVIIIEDEDLRNYETEFIEIPRSEITFNETAENKKMLGPENAIIIEDEDKRNYEIEFIQIPRSETAFNETAENKKTLGPEDVIIIEEDEDKRNYETEFIEIPRSETAFNETAENKKTLGPENAIIIEDEDKRNYEIEFIQIPRSENSLFPKCGLSQFYRCDKCKYKTKYKSKLQHHQLKHDKKTQKHETKRKGDLRVHQSTEEGFLGIKMYKCDTCTYKNKYRKRLKTHELLHKDPLETNTYRCDTSNFENEYCVEKHGMMYVDPSEVQIWKCKMCSFQTKYKNYLNVHWLVHKDPSEIHITSKVGAFMKVDVRRI